MPGRGLKKRSPRTPLGPSVKRMAGSEKRGRGVVCQKSWPEGCQDGVGWLVRLLLVVVVREGAKVEAELEEDGWMYVDLPARREIFSSRVSWLSMASISDELLGVDIV